MKKLLILSDIHANWPALEAVLKNERFWDRVAFCGDVVGVGPQPIECVRWVAEHAEFAVPGDLDNARILTRCEQYPGWEEAPAWHSTIEEHMDEDFKRRDFLKGDGVRGRYDRG
jgi:predicted phosphodiesterase